MIYSSKGNQNVIVSQRKEKCLGLGAPGKARIHAVSSIYSGNINSYFTFQPYCTKKNAFSWTRVYGQNPSYVASRNL